MSAVEVLNFEGEQVRTVMVDGEPNFVAVDVARVLGYVNTADAVRKHTKGVANRYPLATAGGTQMVRVLSEADTLRMIVNSNLPAASRFERWVFEDVLPTIRRTGSYVPPETPEQAMARAVLVAQGIIERRDEQIAELTPRAEAWDELADAGTDYSVSDAAAMLVRVGVETGRQRLFDKLRDMRWIYRGEGGRWRPYADKLDAGYLCERAMPPRINGDGDLVPVPPQVRVTARGLERLRVRLGVIKAVAS